MLLLDSGFILEEEYSYLSELKKETSSDVDKTKKSKQCVMGCSLSSEQCNAQYIGETVWMLGASMDARPKHMLETGHRFPFDQTKILYQEDNTFKGRIQQALHIYWHRPILNRDRGYEIHP